MLEAPRTDSVEGDYVQFIRAGASANGEFHCSSCGYGIAVYGLLPRCPMCAGKSWEPVDSPSVNRQAI